MCKIFILCSLYLLIALDSVAFGLFSSFKKLGKVNVDNRISLKNSIVKEALGTSNGVRANEKNKKMIFENVRDLEKLNKIKSISNSQLMDGNWDLVFTTNDGSSAGKLGPFIGKVKQKIDVESNSYSNFVYLGPIEGCLDATWENLSSSKWKVLFLNITLKFLNIPIIKKKFPSNQTGIWRMSYIDDDFRILYAQGGKNADKENIYILKKEGNLK